MTAGSIEAARLALRPMMLQLAQRLSQSSKEACRLFDGRDDSAPEWAQIAIDYYHPVLLVSLEAPLAPPVLEALLDGLEQTCALFGAETIVCQSCHLAGKPVQVMRGALPSQPIATEDGLKYGIVLATGLPLGFALEWAEARRWLATVSAGKRVLNLYADTCVFSVVARASGATHAVNLEPSAAALRQGQQNHQLNGVGDGVSYLSHNVFKSWGRLRRSGPFDVIIVSPPNNNPGSFLAERDYPRVISKLPSLCAPGAEVLLCLDSPQVAARFLLDAVAQQAPQLLFIKDLRPAVAFDERDHDPALKLMCFTYSDSM
ncbi:SAM-dependent methyltransferase [Halieaceae bacterium IMCC14734]|uniref:SAM-dependent methyltransferase n=1 Tax=Candidatus Litorirhabdus singularis TaxID=2518993 RepID=A0ABT3TGL7_9GAMM|nr:class I SAM-dependent methyltransferase [Candidatus Litorirhabdus singularis]MCX2981457.1 SAM-dependent methyltransferase [Candidatus Litorirhabdus singularis]